MTKIYSPHIFCICVLFILGNTVITLPFYNSGIVAFLVGAVLSLVLLFISILMINWGQKYKVVFYVYAFAVCVAAIYGVITTFLDYLLFLKSIQMPKTNIYLLSIILLGIVLFFTSNSISAIYKYGLFTAIICGLIIIICFLSGIKNFDFSLLKTTSLTHNFSIKYFLPIIVLPSFTQLQKHNIKYVFSGVLTAFLVLILCFFQTTFTIGADSNTVYPYLRAVSVISSGSLFTRLDGLVYFLFFVCAVIKICVCIKSVFLICKTKTSV